MDIIINKAKKDYIKFLNRPTLESIYTIKGFLSYLMLRNLYPSIKDLTLYISELLEIYLVYKLLGKEFVHIGILGFLFFKFINVFSRIISYSLREKILELINSNKKELISRYFSSALSFSLLFFLLLVFVLSVSVNFENTAFSTIFFNKIFVSAFFIVSSLYFQSTYIISRVYFNLYLVLLAKLISLSFIILSFKYFGYYSFVLYFYIDGILQLLITYLYASRVLFVHNIKLFSSDIKNYYKNLFWFFLNSKLKFTLRSLSLFLANSQKIIIILIVSYLYPNYLIVFFIIYQIFNFLLLVTNRVSRSMYFDVSKQSFFKNNFVLNRLLINNFVITLVLSFINIYLFMHLGDISLVYSKWEAIYTNLLILNKWTGLYLLIFFSGFNLFFYRILEFSESHLLNIILSVINYVLIFVLLINNNYFIQSHNPVCFFYINGFVSLIMFTLFLIAFLSKMWIKNSFLYNLSKDKFDYDDIDSFLSKKNKNIFLFTINKKFQRKQDLFYSILEEELEIVAKYKFSFNTYILVFKESKKAGHLKKIIYQNVSFMCNQIISLNKVSISDLLKENKFIFSFMYPKLFEFKVLKNFNKSNLDTILGSAKSLKKTYSILRLLNFYERLLIPEQIIFKKDIYGVVPVYRGLKLEKCVKFERIKDNELKNIFQKIIINLFLDFLEGINKD